MTLILLVPGKVGLPPHAIGQCESPRHLELVLEKEAVLPGDRIAARLTKADIQLIEGAQQKVGHCYAGTNSCKGDAAALGEPVVQCEIDIMAFIAPFQRVAAMNPAHGI